MIGWFYSVNTIWCIMRMLLTCPIAVYHNYFACTELLYHTFINCLRLIDISFLESKSVFWWLVQNVYCCNNEDQHSLVEFASQDENFFVSALEWNVVQNDGAVSLLCIVFSCVNEIAIILPHELFFTQSNMFRVMLLLATACCGRFYFAVLTLWWGKAFFSFTVLMHMVINCGLLYFVLFLLLVL